MSVTSRLVLLACTVAALAALGANTARTAAQDRSAAPEAATGLRTGGPVATAKSFMISAANPAAVEAGLEMLRAGRQRRRCRHCRAAGPQSGRAAIVRARRRRVHPALGRSQPEARELRRAGDGAGRGDTGSLPGRRPSAQVRRCRVRRPQRGRARRAARPRGRAQATRPAALGATFCAGDPACHRWLSRLATLAPAAALGGSGRASRPRRGRISSTRPATPGLSAICSRTRNLRRPCAPSPRVARMPSTPAPSPKRSSAPCARLPTTGATSPQPIWPATAPSSASPSASATGAIGFAAWARPLPAGWRWRRSSS